MKAGTVAMSSMFTWFALINVSTRSILTITSFFKNCVWMSIICTSEPFMIIDVIGFCTSSSYRRERRSIASPDCNRPSIWSAVRSVLLVWVKSRSMVERLRLASTTCAWSTTSNVLFSTSSCHKALIGTGRGGGAARRRGGGDMGRERVASRPKGEASEATQVHLEEKV